MAPIHAVLAAYECKLITLTHAVKHWRPYLWGRSFVVKTDNYNLKYLLNQRLSTIPQHHWINKLMGFDFIVEYKPGKTNTVADALSRCDTDAGESLALSSLTFHLWNELRLQADEHEVYKRILTDVQAGRKGPDWEIVDDLVMKARRVFVLASLSIVQVFLEHAP
jgi:hypothetical protein